MAVASGERLRVAVSVPPQAWLVEQIAGTEIDVTIMVPPGNSPATWNLTPAQYRELTDTQLYFSIGHPSLLLEARLINPFLERHPELSRVNLYDMTDSLSFIEPGDRGKLDPHVWLSPEVVISSLPALTAALIAIAPGQADLFESNRKRLALELDILDTHIRRLLDPLSQRQFMVQHPAWGWYAAQYGLEQLSIEHHGHEPAPSELISLIKQARILQLRAVFVQVGFSSRSATMLARELDIALLEMDPLARDWLANMYHITGQLEKSLEQHHE
jgi:zinc transport system substrate-binding protein